MLNRKYNVKDILYIYIIINRYIFNNVYVQQQFKSLGSQKLILDALLFHFNNMVYSFWH